MTSGQPRVGVSSCLLGEEVRFNGGHKRYRFLTDSLDRYVDWVLYCPEIQIGLGTPREAIRLTADGRLVNRSGTADHTAAMAALPLPADLDGYVFKAKSPSCGIRAIPRYRDDGQRDHGRAADQAGRGLYASRVLSAFPLLAVEDEGRLNDPGLREEFVERIFAAARLRSFLGRAVVGGGPGRLPRPAQAADAGPRPSALPVGGAGGGRGRHRAAEPTAWPTGCSWPRSRARPSRPQRRRAAAAYSRSAGNSTGRGATTWWAGSRPTGAARSRSACRSRCSRITPPAALAGGADLSSGPSRRTCACGTPFGRERGDRCTVPLPLASCPLLPLARLPAPRRSQPPSPRRSNGQIPPI